MKMCKKKCFSLIEMIAVVFLAIIIFVSVIPSSHSSEEQLELQYEANVLRSTIRYAQTLALRDERAGQKTVVDITGTGYSVTSSGVDVVLPYSDVTTRIFDKVTGDVKEVEFNSWGVPIDDTGNELVEDIDIVLTHSAAGLSETVKVLAKTGFVQ